jgi:succinate dehydrogenase / fumarate reductase membrane anchor subunit
MSFRTPLARVRGLGSAKSGTENWWHERLSAVASIPTTLFLIWLAMAVAGRERAAIIALLGHPAVAMALALSIIVMLWHMRLGMQVIIEDYIHGEGMKLALMMLNIFFAILVGAACAYALIKLAFGG